MNMKLDRKTLQEIIDLAQKERDTCKGYFVAAFGELMRGATRLHAMLARQEADSKAFFTSETCPKCGWYSLRHELTEEEKNRSKPSSTPCPFCGVESSRCEMIEGGYYVKCTSCDASTGTFRTPALALTAWMRRPNNLPQPK